jgi:hypothetical protein
MKNISVSRYRERQSRCGGLVWLEDALVFMKPDTVVAWTGPGSARIGVGNRVGTEGDLGSWRRSEI